MKRFTVFATMLLISGFSLSAQNYYFSVFLGDTILLNVSNSGGGTVEWQSTTDTSAGNWIVIPGASGNNYQLIVPFSPGQNFIRAMVTNPSVCSQPYYGSTIKLRVVTSTNEIQIGDYYAGGFVFYKDINGSGFVVSPYDIAMAEWGCMGTYVSALSPGFGMGAINTSSIVASSCLGAALVCDTLKLNGYSDWFLPSVDELDSIYNKLGSFTYCNFSLLADPYWASFETLQDEAAVQYFGTGLKTTRFKNSPALVRAVRTFAPVSQAPLTVQQRLNNGESPLQIVNSGIQIDSLYGKFYQGGLIFYFDQAMGTGLVAAPMEQSPSANFGCMNLTIGTTSTAFGSGLQNTIIIASTCTGPLIAAIVCDTLTLYGFTDWFLPSRDEIQFMKTNLYDKGLGNFTGNTYWSSSEVSASNAWALSISTGPVSVTKSLSGAVRAVHAFSPNVQQRLDAGQTPLQIYESGMQIDSLYGKMYQNGLIFYLDTLTGAGLVSAVDDQSTLANWGCQGTFLNSRFSLVGSGKFNSDTIISKCYAGSGAIQACANYTTGGYNWYLPSKDEWLLMYQNLYMYSYGNFAATNYWTSTETDPDNAWMMRVWNGDQISTLKDNTTYIRAVHAYGLVPFICPVIDIDGNEYPTVQIGTQTWMAANLRTSHYKDGNIIPIITDSPIWATTYSPARCWYQNDSAANNVPYGQLYNYYAIETGNVCPSGWHVPDNTEIDLLLLNLGGASTASPMLRVTGTVYWIDGNLSATNSSGFSATGTGLRWYYDGSFTLKGTLCRILSATPFDTSNSYNYLISDEGPDVTSEYADKKMGVTVRCIKD